MKKLNKEADMRLIANRLITAVTIVITMTAIIAVSTSLAKRVGHFQSSTMNFPQPGPEILGNSYNAMMNNLFAASGR